MSKILMPVDGSDNANRVVGFLIKQLANTKEPIEIHLLNVQHSFPGTIKGVADQAKQRHRDKGAKALAGACKLLDDGKLEYTYHISVGEGGEVIAHFVKDLNIDQVVMGCTGSGAVVNVLMGSTATKVLDLVSVPVMLVRP